MIKIWRYYGSYFGAGGTITDTAITETTTADMLLVQDPEALKTIVTIVD